MGALISTLAFPVPPKEWASGQLRERPDLVPNLKTASGIGTVAVHIQRGAPFTLLYSHGNAEDVGLSLPYLDKMADTCGVNVFAYEYCGYGLAEGDPSEENCYLCIDAAYEYLRQKVDPSTIIVFGRSLGSGPSTDLVSRHPEIRGLVLQSPLESGARAVFGKTVSYVGYYMDIFKNYEKIPKVECPVFIMHGTKDEVVPFHNGEAMHAACKVAAKPYWVEGRGHNNMPDTQCLEEVKRFVQDLAQNKFAR
jgi:pimeloyl-ACP methyl ester carboxylesterase